MKVLRKTGSHYILVMMLITRLIGSVGGTLTIYYVSLTLRLPPDAARHFFIAAGMAVILAVVSTSAIAIWETRCLRGVLRDLMSGLSVELPRAIRAGREAVRFCGVHHLHEAILVPLVTTVPVCTYMYWQHRANGEVLAHICIATFLGISMSLLLSFFSIDRFMQPVIQYLLDEGVPIPYGQLPQSKLQLRVIVCFSLIITNTAVMIGALANQRALDIVREPALRDAAVQDLRRHIVYIFAAAVVIGIGLSVVLARSVAVRVAALVKAMKLVEQGHFSERLWPTGNDELDTLARQFNIMTEQLNQNDHTIRDLNSGLERKVKRRTRQLTLSRRKLKRSLNRLVEHDRMKTEFFSNVSHELRTPLTMILAPVDRLLDHRDSLAPEAANMLEMVRLNGYRLLDLINRLLDFSKLEAGQMKLQLGVVDVNGLVEKLVAAATPLAAQRRIELVAQCDPAIGVFGADEEKIETVIANLISNAMKFTPQGGRVCVETHAAPDRMWLSVTDTGIGIDESQQDRIFQRFVQVDGSSSREFSGTGLGLSLAQGLVQLHGGEIHISSALGKGSRFWFDVPYAEVPATEMRTETTPTVTPALARRFAELEEYVHEERGSRGEEQTGAFSTHTVLVVDDSPDMCALLSELLQDEYRVFVARDGQEGLDVVRREHPDLILSDVMMPRLDGQEFCRHIKSDPQTAHIPFVMLTAKAELSMKIDGLNCGADDYLTKPFSHNELKARVHSLVKLRGMHLDLNRQNRELETAYNELRAPAGPFSSVGEDELVGSTHRRSGARNQQLDQCRLQRHQAAVVEHATPGAHRVRGRGILRNPLWKRSTNRSNRCFVRSRPSRRSSRQEPPARQESSAI